MDLFELTATLSLDTREFESRMASAERRMASMERSGQRAGNSVSNSARSVGSVFGKIASGFSSFGEKASSVIGKVSSIATGAFGAVEKISGGIAKVGGGLVKSFEMVGKAGGTALKGLTSTAGMTAHALEGIGKAALAGVGAITALGAAFVPMVRSATSAYGEYEQMVGGITTLFDETDGSAITVMNNARRAYHTAGMSMNQYMETVTMSASKLIQDLGGDRQRAAEVADMAITDMADNVNKMGTSMESIQFAYRGFMMGNFRMLDNLHIGYNGTEAEMERLLRRAEEIEADAGRTVHFSIDSYADIVQAIHIVQQEIGITGTTVNEANTTITGSLAATKAAWENVMTVLADPDAVDQLPIVIEQFTDNAQTFLDNLIPSIRRAFQNIPTLIRQLSPVISRTLPDLLSNLLPDILAAGFDIGTSLLSGIWNFITGTNWMSVFGRISRRIRLKWTQLLGLNRNASGGEITAALVERIREAVSGLGGRVRVGIARLLGLTNADGSPIIDPDNATWARIAAAIPEAVQRFAGIAKVGIANLLGLTGPDGAQITDADQVEWGTIARAIGDKIRTWLAKTPLTLAQLLGMRRADGSALTENDNIGWPELATYIRGKIISGLQKSKVTLANLLGMTKADGSAITENDDVSWSDIGKYVRGKIREGFQTMKVSLGNLLGLTDENGKPLEDPSWTQVGSAALQAIMRGLRGGNDFLKRLLLGDDVYEQLQSEIAGGAKEGFEGIEVPWSNVVDQLFEEMRAGFEGYTFFGDIVSLGLDVVTGLGTFATNLATEISNALGQPGIGSEFGSALASIINGALEQAPTWISNITNFATELVDELADPENITRFVNGVFDTLISVVDGTTQLGNSLTSLINGVLDELSKPDTWTRLMSSLNDAIGSSITGGTSIVSNLIGMLIDVVTDPGFLDALGDTLMTAIVGGLLSPLDIILTTIADQIPVFNFSRENGTAFHQWGVYQWADEHLGTRFLPDSRPEEKTTDELIAEYRALYPEAIVLNVAGGHVINLQNEDGSYTREYGDTEQEDREFRSALMRLIRLGEGRTDDNTLREVDNPFGTPYVVPASQWQRNASDSETTPYVSLPEGQGQVEWNRMSVILGHLLGHSLSNGEMQALVDSGIQLPSEFSGAWNQAAITYDGNQATMGDKVFTFDLDTIRAILGDTFTGPVGQPITASGAEVNAGTATINAGTVEIDGVQFNTFGIPGEAGSAPDGSDAKGLWSVPYDDYLANLHRDEMVLTASQARDYREGNGGTTAMLVGAIQELRNDMQNLRIFVGERAFGQTVVDYSGRRMRGYLGREEDRMYSGYGWG